MIRVACDRHATRIGSSDGLSLKLRAGALPDVRASLDFCEACRAEFVAWLGDRDPLPVERERVPRAVAA
jgi:hypothetical protein